mgnify:FL=1
MTLKLQQYSFIIAVGLATAAPAFADNHDPYEPYNRFMYRINDGIDRTVMTPVARGYQKVTPKPVQSGITNVFDNLRDVVSIGSNLLRLDIEKASTDLVRVGINTTFGLGGLINIADAAQMPNNKNSLGDTFATWGWKNSNYFVYPLTGPSTVRDAVGDTITRVYSVEGALVDSEGWSWGLTALKGIDKRAQLLVYTDGLDMAAVDRYAYTRDVFMNMRATQVGGTPPSAEYDETNIDDLVPADAGNSEPEDTAAPASDDTSSLNDATLLPGDGDKTELSALDAEQTAVSDIATAHVDAAELPIATATELAPAQYADDLALLH